MPCRVDRGFVSSADGTRIGYRRLGSGPAVILLHGAMMASQNLLRLATELGKHFTVYVPDRRGRGETGDFGPSYCMAREAEDLRALVESSGAERAFGLSSGAIILLHASLELPALRKLALYEPPLLLAGSSHTDWVPQFEREVEQGELAAAMATVVAGTGDPGGLALMPRFLLVPFFRLALNAEAKTEKPGEVPLAALIPTMRYDAQLVSETAGALAHYDAIRAEVLLLGGSKSAAYLRQGLDALARALPRAVRVELADVGHLAADNGGKPVLVAEQLRAFFT
jgi:pimeloyl-ACP methyl ester carboxylesterase